MKNIIALWKGFINIGLFKNAFDKTQLDILEVVAKSLRNNVYFIVK